MPDKYFDDDITKYPQRRSDLVTKRAFFSWEILNNMIENKAELIELTYIQ